MKARELFVFLTIFSLLFISATSQDDSCPSGMRKTYVDDLNMNQYGSARRWLGAVCFFQFPGSLWFSRRVLIEPRFEVHYKAAVDAIDVVENQGEQKIYGFTMVISGEKNTVSGLEGRSVSGGTSASLTFDDIGYNNFINALIIEFDFNPDYADPSDNSFSIRYCDTHCYSQDVDVFVSGALNKQKYDPGKPNQWDFRLVYQQKTLYLYSGPNDLLHSMNIDLETTLATNIAYVGFTGFMESNRGEINIMGTFMCEDNYVITKMKGKFYENGEMYEEKDYEPGKTINYAFSFINSQGEIVPHTFGYNIWSYKFYVNQDCSTKGSYSISKIDDRTLLLTIPACTTLGQHWIRINEEIKGTGMDSYYNVVPGPMKTISLVGHDGIIASVPMKSDTDVFFLNYGESSSGDFIIKNDLKIVLDFLISDQYGNKVSVTSSNDLFSLKKVNNDGSTSNINTNVISFILIDNGNYYKMIISVTEIGTYQIEKNDYMEKPIRFNVLPGEASSANSYCEIIGYNSPPTVNIGVKLTYVCHLRDTNGNEIPINIFSQNSKYDFICKVDKSWPSSYSYSPVFNGISSYYDCNYTTSEIGDFAFAGYFRLKSTKENFKITTKINQFYVRGSAKEYTIKKIYDPSSNSWMDIDTATNTIITYVYNSQGFITALDFADVGGNILVSSYERYPEDFSPDNLNVTFYSPHDEKYNFKNPIFRQVYLGEKPYIGLYAADGGTDTLIKKSSFNYYMKFTYFNSEKSAAIKYPLNIGTYTTCFHDLNESNTNYNFESQIELLTGGEEKKLGTLILKTIDNNLYNEDIGASNIKLNLSPPSNNIQFRIVPLSIEGTYDVYANATQDYNGELQIIINDKNIKNIPIISEPSQACYLEWVNTQGFIYKSQSGKEIYYEYNGPFYNGNLLIYFRLKDKYNNTIEKEDYFTKFSDISSEEYGTDSNYFIISYNNDSEPNEKYFIFRDNIPYANRQRGWIFTMREKTCNYKYYVRYDGKNGGSPLSEDNSYFSLLSTEININYEAFVDIIYKDKNNQYFGLQEGKLNDTISRTSVTAKNTQGHLENFELVTITSNYGLRYKSKFPVSGNYIIEVTLDNKYKLKYENTNLLKVIDNIYDLRSSKLKMIIDTIVDLDLNVRTTINNILYEPIFRLDFYSKDNVKTDYNKNDEFILRLNSSIMPQKIDFNVDKSSDEFIKFTIPENQLEHFHALKNGEYKLELQGEKDTLSFPLFLLGDNNTDYSNDQFYNIEKTGINPTYINGIAGKTYTINIELRASDGLRWNYKVDLSKFQITYTQEGLTEEDIIIKKEAGPKKGQVVIFIIQKKVTTITANNLIFHLNNSQIPTQVPLTIKCADLKQLKLHQGPTYGNVTDPPVIFFEPLDSYNNLYTDLFTSSKTQSELNELTVGTSKDRVSLASNNYLSEGKYLVVQYISTISTDVVVTSDYFEESYNYRIYSGPIDKEKSFAEIKSITNKVGEEYILLISPKDLYNNNVDGLNNGHINQFLIYYQIVGSNNKTEVNNCYLIQRSSNDDLRILLEEEEEISLTNFTHIECKTNIIRAGKIEFFVEYQTKNICKNKCVFYVIPSDVFFFNTQTFYTNKGFYLNLYGENVIEIGTTPIFEVLFYDIYNNEIDANSVNKINIEATFDGTEVKLCVTNQGKKKSITVCPTSNGDDNENKFKYLTNGDDYNLFIQDIESPTNILKYPITITGGASDGSSSGPVDLTKTEINPVKLDLIAGEEGCVNIELQTALRKRKNYWYPEPSEIIKIIFQNDQDTCRANVEKGELPGQYKILVTCTKATSLNYLNIVIEDKTLDQHIALTVKSGLAFFLEVENLNLYTVSSDKYTWKTNPSNDDSISFSFKFKDKYQNYIKDNLINSNQFTIASETFGSNAYYSLDFDSNKFNYVFTDEITKVITQHTWNIIVVESNRKYSFIYTKVPGAPDTSKSYWSIDKTSYLLMETSSVSVYLLDRLGVNLGTIEGKLKNELSKVKTITNNGTDYLYKQNSISSDNIGYTFKYEAIGNYKVSVAYDGKLIGKKKDIDIVYQRVDLLKSKLYYKLENQDEEIQMSISTDTNIDNLLTYPSYKFILYTAEGERITLYDKNLESTCFMTYGGGNERWEMDVVKFDQYLKLSYKEGFREKFSKLPFGKYNIEITFDNEIIRYPLFLLGEKDVSASSDYDLGKIYIKPTEIEAIAGEEKEIEIEFRASDGLRWNYDIVLISFGISNSYSLNDDQLKIKKIKGTKSGQMKLYINQTLTTKGKPNILTLTYASKKISQTISLNVKSSNLKKIVYQSGCKDGTVVNPPTLQFKPLDLYGNLCEQIFDSTEYPNDKLQAITKGVSDKGYTLTSKVYAENEILFVQYGSDKVTTITVTSNYCTESYVYKLTSGPIDPSKTYAQVIKKDVFKAGEITIINIYPKDKNGNDITYLSDIEITYFEVHYKIDEESSNTISKDCKKIGGNTNYINCETNITKSGDAIFGVDYNDKAVQCQNCEFNIIPSSLYFSNTKVINKNTNKEMSLISYNTITVTINPSFSLIFYDRYMNAIINMNEVHSLNVNTKLEVTDVKLCVENSGINKLSSLCKSTSYDENEERWKYITSGNRYQFIVYTQTESLTYPVQITGGYTDGDSSPIDITKTYINPSILSLIAGVEGTISLELRTKDNTLKNYWYKDPRIHLGVIFPDDIQNCVYSIAKGGKPGQYSFKFNCTEKKDTFQSKILVENTEIPQKISMKIVPNEPNWSKLYKLDGTEITKSDLGSVSVEDKFQMINKLYDKYNNLITNIDFDLSILGIKIGPSNSVKNHEYSAETTAQNSGDIIITLRSTYAGNHIVVGTILPLMNYTITFTPGRPSAEHSYLEVSKKEAFVAETVKIYITPYDQYSNLIEANDFKDESPYQVKYINGGDTMKVILEKYTIEAKDSINVISYSGEFYVRGNANFYGYLDTKQIKCLSCRIDIKSKDIDFESSLVMRYDYAKNDYEILQNGIKENNAKEEPIYRLYPRDKYLNEIDFIPSEKLKDYKAYLESQKESVIYRLTLNNENSTDPQYAEFVAIDDPSEYFKYSTLVTGYYNLIFTDGVKIVKYNIYLNGDEQGGSNEEADFQMTRINEQNLKFAAGESGHLIIELRTAKDIRHNSWGKNKMDYNIVVESCPELNESFKATPSRAGLLGVFQIIITSQKSNTYPKLKRCPLNIYIDSILINNLHPEMEVSPNVIVKTVILEQYYKTGSKVDLINGNADTNYIFEVASYDQYNNLAETKQEIIGLKVNYKGGEEITKTTSENENDTGYRKYIVPATKAGNYIVSTSKSGSQGIYLENEANFLINPGAIDLSRTVIKEKISPIQAGEKPIISILAYDKYGNILEYQDYINKFNAIFIDSNSKELLSTPEYDSNVQRVYYKSNEEITIVGNTKVNVVYDNKEKIDTSKIIIEVYPGDPYPPNSILSREISSGTFVEYQDGNSFIIDTTQALKLNVTLYDKYNNYVDDLPTNAKVDNVEMSGNRMKIIKFSVVKNTGHFDLDFNGEAKYVHIYQHLVKGTYDLNFKVTSSLGEKTFHYNMIITTGDNLHGNGDYKISECVLAPKETSFIAGNYGKFTLELRTDEKLLYNDDIDINRDINVNTASINGNSFRYTIAKEGTNYGIYTITIYSEKKGEYTLNIELTDLSSSSGQKKNVNAAKYKVTPDPIPDKKHTIIISQPDPNVPVDSQIGLIFNLYDKFNNKIEDSDKIVSTKYFTLLNNNEPYSYTSLSFDNRVELYLMPKYPPKSMSLNLLYDNGKSTVFIFEEDIKLNIQTSIDYMKTQIISRNKEKIQAGDILDMWLYTLDKSYKCLDNGDLSRQFRIEVMGPLDSPHQFTKTYNIKKTVISSGDNSQCNNEYIIDTVKDKDEYKYAGKYLIKVIFGENNLIAQYNQVCEPLSYDKFYLKYNFDPDHISILDSPSFSITGEDRYGNIVKDPLYDDIDISFTHNNEETVLKEIKKSETQQGMLTYQVTIQKVGSHQLHLYYNEKEITKVNGNQNLPIFTVLTGPCYAENNTHFDLSPLNDTEISLKTYFIFYCYDKLGNKITSGGEKFSVKAEYITGDTIPLDDAKVVDNGDGSYNVEFVPMMKGIYLFNILLGKEKYGEEVKYELTTFKCTEGNKTILCPNKKLCVSSLLDCIEPRGKDCNISKPFYCKVKEEFICTESQLDCDCPDGYDKCEIMKYCVPEGRKDMCPTFKNVLPICWTHEMTMNFDGVCRAEESGPSQRVCPIGKVLCADLSCRDNYDQCIVTEKRTSKDNRCIGQQIVPEAYLCPSSITCKEKNYVVCPNGQCVKNEIECPSLNKCNANYPYLCQNDICAESYEACPLSVSCGENKLLCSDNICREKC